MYYLINKLKSNQTNKQKHTADTNSDDPYTQYVLLRQFFLLFKINITRPCILHWIKRSHPFFLPFVHVSSKRNLSLCTIDGIRI